MEGRAAEPQTADDPTELERLVDLSADLLCTTGMDGRFRRLNPAWSLTLGYAESELVGRWWIDFVHPEDRDETLHGSNVLLEPGGDVSNFENRFVHRDGSYRWLSWSARSDGHRVYAVARDMTAQRLDAERFTSAFENAPIGEAIFGKAGDGEIRVLEVNRVLCDMLGYTREEMLARPPTSFGHPDDRDVGLEGMKALLAGDAASYALHKRLLRKDGESIVAELQISVLRDAGGGALYTLAQIQDVTARRAVDQALRSSEERYRTIVETTSEGVWMIDAEHHTTYVNPRMAEMLGYEIDEMLGRPALEFTPADRRGAVSKRIQRRREGEAEQREELLCHKDGSDVWVLLSGSPITDRQGRYAGALAMMADITERRRAEARAAQLAGIVEASPDAIVSLSLDGMIETFNGAAEAHSGWTAAEVIGKPVTLMVPPEQADSVPRVLATVAGGRTLERLRVELLDKHGEREETSLSVAPIPGPDGSVAGIACLIRATAGG